MLDMNGSNNRLVFPFFVRIRSKTKNNLKSLVRMSFEMPSLSVFFLFSILSAPAVISFDCILAILIQNER